MLPSRRWAILIPNSILLGLDGPGFAPFGRITTAKGMAVVERLYHGYGDEGGPGSLCAQGSTYPFCKGVGKACQGVNVGRFPKHGNAYLDREFPLLDHVKGVRVTTVNCRKAGGCLKPLL